MMNHKRFSRKLGEYYDKIKIVWPYYHKLRIIVGKKIKEFTRRSKLDEIKVLEIGCGTGDLTKIILKSSDKIKIVTIDNEKIFINQLKKNQDPRLKIIKGDALITLTKMKSSSFNIFASSFVLHNFDKKYRHKVLLEIFRILKDDGFFITADKYVVNNALQDKKRYYQQIKKLNIFDKIKMTKLKKELIEHEEKDRSFNYIMREKDSIKEMKSISFKEIKIINRIKREAVLIARK